MTSPAAAPKPTPKSPFVVAFASLLHSGDFIAAAEHLERALLLGGITVGEAVLPPPAAELLGAAGPELVDEAVALTDREISRATGAPAQQPPAASGEEIAGHVASALTPLFGKLLGAIEKLGK